MTTKQYEAWCIYMQKLSLIFFFRPSLSFLVFPHLSSLRSVVGMISLPSFFPQTCYILGQNIAQFHSGNIKFTKKSCSFLTSWNQWYLSWSLIRDYLLNSSFQQAVIRNVNDRNAQLQKQLENVVREGKEECHLFLTFLLLLYWPSLY